MKFTDYVSRFLIIVLPILAEIGCAADRPDSSSQKDSIQPITSVEQFNSIIENAGNKLVVFNLYADWCMPCHALAPTLAEIAYENRSKIIIYKIDTDQFPQITAAFGVTGIPFVVFVKNKKAIYALIGVQPKDSYTKVIDAYADSTNESIKPRGRKVEGVQIKDSNYRYLFHQSTTDNGPQVIKLQNFLFNNNHQQITSFYIFYKPHPLYTR